MLRAMGRYRSPLLPLFRTLLLGLLALGVVAKPVLGELCDAHALAHLLAREAAANDPVRQRVDSAAEARSDRDHASGADQALHASDATPAFIEIFPALTVPPAHFASVALPLHEAATFVVRAFDSPFRPPIA